MPQVHFTLWGIVRTLANIAIALLALAAYSGRADRHRKAVLRSNGRLQFSPNRRAILAWLLIEGYLTWFTVGQWMHAHQKLDFVSAAGITALTAMLLFEVPGTIVVGSDGLQQIYWVGTDKRIGWEEIAEVNTGDKSGIVTVKSKKGRTIVHLKQLPDRPRFLFELKQHCGAELPPDFPREPISGSETDGE